MLIATYSLLAEPDLASQPCNPEVKLVLSLQLSGMTNDVQNHRARARVVPIVIRVASDEAQVVPMHSDPVTHCNAATVSFN